MPVASIRFQFSTHCPVILGLVAAVLAGLSGADALAQSPATIHLPGVVRDFQKTNVNFAVTPVGGNGHYAGNIGQAISSDGAPIFIGGGFKVVNQWRNSGGQPIPPNLYVAGGGGGGIVSVTSLPANSGNSTVDSFNSTIGPYGGSNVGPAPTWLAGSPMPNVAAPSGLPGLINAVTYSGNGTSTLSADVHCNTFTVRNNRTLQISGVRTVLVEQTFTMDNHSQITLLANASLTVYIKNAFTMDNNIDVNMNTHTPSRFTIINLGTTELSFGNHVHVYAAVISPNAAMHIKNNADFYGTLTGKTAILDNSAGFHNDGSGTPPPTMCGAVINDSAGTPGITSSGGIVSASVFANWYKDAPGTNLSAEHTITLVKNSSGVYEYIDDAFHPIDNQLYGNQGQSHNNYFTYAISAPFVHHACAGTFFEFYGTDDAWLFINGKLAMDLGGVVPGTSQYVEIDRLAGLQDGQTYTMHFFYAQRQATQAVFHMRTNMSLIGTTLEATVSGSGD